MGQTKGGKGLSLQSSLMVTASRCLGKKLPKREQVYSDRTLSSFSASSNEQFKKFVSQKCHLGYDI